MGRRAVTPSSLPPPPGQRIHVVGTSCSGKTTMAASLSEVIGGPHVELDALHWGPNWEPAPREVLRPLVKDALIAETWAIDGNYGMVRDIVWPRADTVVWLDYTLPLVLWRMFKRTSRRIVHREELWNGNRETARQFLFARDSLLIWALQTHGKHRRVYPDLLSRPENAHLTVVRLTSPRLADDWLAEARTLAATRRPASAR